jgi:hypothetical protein
MNDAKEKLLDMSLSFETLFLNKRTAAVKNKVITTKAAEAGIS